jgi:enoyl-CoA hydratase
MGGAFDLATLCDIRVCSNIALFGHNEIKFGAPPVFTPLRWIVGSGLARDLCMTGRRIDAQEAFRIGLVSEVVSSEELISRATQIANSILESPVDALQFTKSYFTSNEGRGFEESFYIEHDKAFQEVLLRKAKQGLKR